MPSQSQLQFDFLIPSVFHVNYPWRDDKTLTYIKIKPLASVQEVDAKIQQLVEGERQYQAIMKEKNRQVTYFTQPLTSIHLSPQSSWELAPNGNRLYIQVLTMGAFFILLIVGINYVNLATAKSAMRAKEIGLRKVVGAFRKTLVYQFLAESILASVVAGIFAVCLAELLLPFFNTLMQKKLSLMTVETQPVWGFIAASVFVFGIASGLYPAFYLSAFNPITNFKKQLVSQRKGFGLRKTLVVSQFALSGFLLVGMIVVQQQMSYVQSANLGFDKNQVIVISNFHRTPNRDQGFIVRSALKTISGVIEVGGTAELKIGLRENTGGGLKVKGSGKSQIPAMANLIDEGYLDVFGLELIAGRNFSRAFPSDLHNGAILNETAVKQLGLEGGALGRKVLIHTNDEYHVIGVVKDYHAASLHNEILPFILCYNPIAMQAVIKLSGGEIRETIAQIEEVWAQFVPDVPLEFYFMDDAINQLYHSERDFHTIFSAMTLLALIIACLGLFGLIAFTAEQRTKEIGVRKVLGATVTNIVTMLSGDFVKLVIIANIFAWPIAYFAMSKWLGNFAYRIDMGPGPFALAGFLALLIAAITVIFQAFKAATANPVQSLRYE